MTNIEAWKAYERYLGAWNTTWLYERVKIANEIYCAMTSSIRPPSAISPTVERNL
jgi:glutamate mutase epsilon subunit